MSDSPREVDLDSLFLKARRGEFLEEEEVGCLLNLTGEEDIDGLFALSRELREKHFGKRVFLYGFIYFSTYCRNDCTFCFYRRTNRVSARYRKSKSEIVETAQRLASSGVNLLDLTMGEDPKYFASGEFEELLDLVKRVKDVTHLPVMVSPGLVPEDVLQEFKNMGVEWYACYQETHNPGLYSKLRVAQSYEERMEVKMKARELGFLIEEGLLAGIGESDRDIYDSLKAMRELKADQVRVMSFVPQKGTPLEHWPSPPHLRELLIIATMRLMFPDKLIPASLDVDGLSGLKERLRAGANVVTSIIPPQTGLLGVSQSTLDIEKGSRSVEGITPLLEECGLQRSGVQAYSDWLAARRGKHEAAPLP